MRSNFFIRLLGFPATLIQGDTLVLDRWRWLRRHFIKRNDGEINVLDVGCGTGAFSIGLSLRGYKTLGLTWDEYDTIYARARAKICKADNCSFEIQDARKLDQRTDLFNRFDYIVCTENIEHILNDQKLINDFYHCLKAGGKLFLTTPNINFISITSEDDAPLQTEELGWHVRRGYSIGMLDALCRTAGLTVERIDFVSGFFSQKVTMIWRTLNKVNVFLSLIVTLPLRVLPIIFDDYIKYPGYSITLIAEKRS